MRRHSITRKVSSGGEDRTNSRTPVKFKHRDSHTHYDFVECGVTIELLHAIAAFAKTKNPDQSWTTSNIWEQVIRPLTAASTTSFIRYFSQFKTTPHPDLHLTYNKAVAPQANVFVSHAWRYRFVDLLSALDAFIDDHKHTSTTFYFWVDLLINDQWNAPTLPYEWWSTTFLTAIGKIGHTCLVLSPWDDPIPLNRAWCLWEIVCTRSTKSKLTIQFSDEEIIKFQQVLSSDFDYVINAFCKIDVEVSEAWNIKDKEMIFDAVRSAEGGFSAVNNMIMDVLREWLAECGRLALNINAVEYDTWPDEKYIKNLHLMHTVGRLLSQQGKYSEAESMYRQAIEGFAKRKSREQFGVKNNLAILCSDMGRYTEAEEVFQEVLAEHTRFYGSEHEATLAIQNNIANIFNDKGEYRKAEDMYERVLQSQLRVYGPNHATTLSTMHNLADVYSDTGKKIAAEELFRKIYMQQKDMLGEDHPNTQITANNLAILLHERNKLDEAAFLFNELLMSQKKVFGSDHPTVYRTIGNLANLLRDKGSYVEAEVLFTEALAGQVSKLGETHPDTLLTMNNMANLMCDMNKRDFAEELYYRTLEQQIATLGDEHLETVNTMYNMAILYKEMGRLAEAEEFCRHAYDRYKTSSGVDHDDTLSAGYNYSVILKLVGKTEESEFYFRETLQRQENKFGYTNNDTLLTMTNLASLLREQGKYNEACQLYQQVFAARVKALGEQDDISLDAGMCLADVLLVLEDFVECEMIYRRLYVNFEEKYGANSEYCQGIRDKIGEVTKKMSSGYRHRITIADATVNKF